MEHSNNLKLPYIMSAQAQKHVTHNEAIRALDVLVQTTVKDQDLTTPPISPIEGDSYIVANSATSDWADKDLQIASWQDGAWMFYTPQEGWLVWVIDEAQIFVFDGLIWSAASSSGGGGTNLNPASGDLIGINATADTTNRLSINSPASLFNHQGNGHQLKVNKNTVTDTSSVLFQTDFSGRAEFGLTGDDDFRIKVSPDGSIFFDSILIDKDSGTVTFPNTVFGGGSISSVFGRAGAVAAVAGDYNFDDITGVSQDVLIGRLTAGSGPQEALTANQVRSF